jgi:tRNA threonylcarbamoyladenosine biosynthesis protein TsaE
MTKSGRFPSRRIDLVDAAATEALGARLASALYPGDVVFLVGGLGAGKTTLARGVVRAWTGVSDLEVPSPTFTLTQLYDGPRGVLWHMDLYRLKQAAEALELGIEDAFAEAVCLIEWPERLGPLAPVDRFALSFLEDGAGRGVILSAHGSRMDRFAEVFGG